MFRHTFEKPFECKDEHCDMKFVTSCDMNRHYNSFHTEEGQKRQKKKENRVYNEIFVKNDINCKREERVDFNCLYNRDEKKNKEENKKYSRIDFYSVFDDFILFTECDEDSHCDRIVSCEISRMMKIQESLTMQNINKPVIWLRFNPDGFKRDGVTQRVLFKDRVKSVLDFMKNYKPRDNFEIHYFYYDEWMLEEVRYYISQNQITHLCNFH